MSTEARREGCPALPSTSLDSAEQVLEASRCSPATLFRLSMAPCVGCPPRTPCGSVGLALTPNSVTIPPLAPHPTHHLHVLTMEQATMEHRGTPRATVGHRGTAQATVGHRGTTQATIGHRGTAQATVGHRGTARATVGHTALQRSTEGPDPPHSSLRTQFPDFSDSAGLSRVEWS